MFFLPLAVHLVEEPLFEYLTERVGAFVVLAYHDDGSEAEFKNNAIFTTVCEST